MSRAMSIIRARRIVKEKSAMVVFSSMPRETYASAKKSRSIMATSTSTNLSARSVASARVALCAPDEDAGEKYQDAAEYYLRDRKPEAQFEKMIADVADRDQLQTDDNICKVERHGEV